MNKGIRVLGVTSLCSGSAYILRGSKHLFFYEFDDIDLTDLLEETERLHKQFNIDLYVLVSSFRNYHVLSFDILPYRIIQTIGAWVRLESDYPLIIERYRDLFLTLRISQKTRKTSPKYLCRFIAPNKISKSLDHYLLYKYLCNIPEYPIWYEDLFTSVNLFFASYTTKHNI